MLTLKMEALLHWRYTSTTIGVILINTQKLNNEVRSKV
jgi:hypothetical protein